MSNNKNNTALLVMDMQISILGVIPKGTTVVNNVAKAIESARSNNIPVIYVVLGFRAGAPEISANNKSFTANKPWFTSADTAEFTTIHPDLAPRSNECVVIKRRVSAFSGSDLEMILKALNIQHVVLTGVSTSGVVLSTVREAADKDYRITVLYDGCADREEEVHQLLNEKVFPRQADVLTINEWIA